MNIRHLAWCGLLASTAAYAQNPPPAGEPSPAPVVEPPPVIEPPPAPPPTVTPAQTEVGGLYRNAGLLFNLNNVFVQPDVLGGWQGFGFGAQKRLGSGKIVRIGVELARTTDPVNIVRTTQTNGTDVVTSFDVQLPANGWSAEHAVAGVLDVVAPLTNHSIAPYLGAGMAVSFVSRDLDFTDDVTVTDQVTEVDNSSDTLSLGARGIAGVTWRISPRFSLFAEYHVNLAVIAWQSDHTATTVENTTSGTPATSRVETEFKETRFMNLDTALGQGGALGLVAHF